MSFFFIREKSIYILDPTKKTYRQQFGLNITEKIIHNLTNCHSIQQTFKPFFLRWKTKKKKEEKIMKTPLSANKEGVA